MTQWIKVDKIIYLWNRKNNNNNMTIRSWALILGKRCKHLKNHNIFFIFKITYIYCKQQIKIYYRIPIVLTIQLLSMYFNKICIIVLN